MRPIQGKIGKPQKTKKHKKINAIDPFSRGKDKDKRTAHFNLRPTNFDQEVPKKLKLLMGSIEEMKKSGRKKSKNKFLSLEKGGITIAKSGEQSPMVSRTSEESAADEKFKKKLDKRRKLSMKRHAKPAPIDENTGKEIENKKDKKQNFKTDQVEEYIDTLHAERPYVEDFTFERRPDESRDKFMKRVEMETHLAVSKSKLEDKHEVPEAQKIRDMIKAKKEKGSGNKKQRLAEKKKKKKAAIKEKKKEKLGDFNEIYSRDKVEFGDVVHAPPVLSVRPKKISNDQGSDKPGSRMPELKEAIHKNIAEAYVSSGKNLERQRGKSLKRKELSSGEKIIADVRRNDFINAYRQMKKVKK